MSRISIIYLVSAFLLIIIFSPSPSYAWDGNRQGFLAGFGLGGGWVNYEQEYGNVKYVRYESGRQSESAYLLDLRLGYAFTDQFALVVTGKSAFFKINPELSEVFPTSQLNLEDEVDVIATLFAVGAYYYFTPQAPAVFITGGVGGLNWRPDYDNAAIEDELDDDMTGLAFYIGLGVEPASHVQFELNLIGSTAKKNYVNDATGSVKVVAITLAAVVTGY